MTEKRFYTDGKYVMQDGGLYVICNGEHDADVVATALNESLAENELLSDMCDEYLSSKDFLENENEWLKKENNTLRQSFDKSLLSYTKTCDDYRALSKKNKQLKREKERYKRLSEIRYENIKNRILSLKEFINDCEDEKVKNALEDLFYSEVKEHDLAKENRELKKEKEFWKEDACNCSNYLSILSMDCQIVQEAICDLNKAIDELDDKFDELNQHRIKMYSR